MPLYNKILESLPIPVLIFWGIVSVAVVWVRSDNKALVSSLISEWELCYEEDPSQKVLHHTITEISSAISWTLITVNWEIIRLADLDAC